MMFPLPGAQVTYTASLYFSVMLSPKFLLHLTQLFYLVYYIAAVDTFIIFHFPSLDLSDALRSQLSSLSLFTSLLLNCFSGSGKNWEIRN